MEIVYIKKIGEISQEMGKVYSMVAFRNVIICACENGIYELSVE